MRKHRLLFALVLIALPIFLSAQTINYTTSWLGSTYGGTTLWIQDMIDYMEVGADGTVYAYTGWDEGSGGARKGTYKDGKVLPNHTRNINFTQVTDKAGKT